MFGCIAQGAGMRLGAPDGCPHIRVKLRAARGDLAFPEAAQMARGFEQEGDTKQAETWRRIEAALRQMQGPHVS